jgi:hypothetical protein
MDRMGLLMVGENGGRNYLKSIEKYARMYYSSGGGERVKSKSRPALPFFN